MINYFNYLIKNSKQIGTYNNFCDIDLIISEDKTIKIEKNGFDLYIPTDCNNDDRGYFFVDSKNGHDCYAYDKESVHSYYILDGSGVFTINGEEIMVKMGATIVIPPYATFYYVGSMKMLEKIEPNFKDENFIVVENVIYEGGKTNSK